jgi:hypothetical protein
VVADGANPLYREAEAFASARDAVARLKGDRYLRRAERNPRTAAPTNARARRSGVRDAALAPAPRRLLERERDVDAVVVFTVPMSHFRGIPTLLRERFGVPVVFYDGDVPMSLPEFGGMDTGFNYYHGADPGEYDLVLSNSEGGLERLLELGARERRPCSGAPTRAVSRRTTSRRTRRASSTATATSSGASGCAAMVGEPRAARPRSTSRSADATSGRHRHARARRRRPVQRLRARDLRGPREPQHHAAAARDRSRLVDGRPFELAAAAAAIVSNPYEGIERWFEPGRELRGRRDADEATATYRELLADPAQAEELGRRARERVLDEHTYAHSGAARARADRAARAGRRAWLSSGASRSSPRSTSRTRSDA